MWILKILQTFQRIYGKNKMWKVWVLPTCKKLCCSTLSYTFHIVSSIKCSVICVSRQKKHKIYFILQKILLDETGLYFICQTYDRFSHVAMILGKMVIALAKEPSARLLKHVVRCYLRLSDNQRACEALCQCLPDQLKDDTFATCLKDDKSTKHWLALLLKNLENMGAQQGGASGTTGQSGQPGLSGAPGVGQPHGNKLGVNKLPRSL